MSSTPRRWSCRVFLALGAIGLLGSANFAEAARPAVAKLLPPDTLAYVGVADTQDLVESFQKTSLGRMAQDPQLKPLVGQLSTAVIEATHTLRERFGLSLDELLALPRGEVVFALVPQTEGRPALLMFADVDETSHAFTTLMEAGTKTVESNGGTHETETIGDTKVDTYQLVGVRNRERGCFVRDGMFVGSTSAAALKEVLKAWDSEPELTFADNPQFITISQSVTESEGKPPHLMFYVDPLGLVEASMANNPGAQVMLAVLPVLGLDGLQGIGGGLTLARGAFDQVTQIHILLEQPRSGVIEAVALGSGDTTPERWVPKDAANYSTLYWDVPKSFDKLATVVDSFQGEGSFRAQAGRALGAAGVDFEKELFPDLAGRFSLVTLIDGPPVASSRGHLLGVRLKGTEAFAKAIETYAAQVGDTAEKKSYGSHTYYQFTRPARPNADPEAFRPQPSVCILGDYLLLADRPSLIELAIRTDSDPSLSLANSLEFKLVASKAERESKTPPAMLQFNRPEEELRFVYNLMTGEGAGLKGLNRMAERNPFMQNVNTALTDHPLPPFAVLAQYLAPGGSFIVDDASGLHYTSFTLRREVP